jgi:hypothetical protein
MHISLLFINKSNSACCQDFGRLLMDSLSANGVSSGDLASWKGALGVLVNGISPKN